MIALYEQAGYSRDRVLIKIAATWEGLQAAKQLEHEFGIHCNITLLFNFIQAVMAAQSNVTLISPFVGRILDWYMAKTGSTYSALEDPGVQSVTQIYNYYKKYNYKTTVMGASFRNKDEIEALIGCDCLTISPAFLAALQNDIRSRKAFQRVLDVSDAKEREDIPEKLSPLTETQFRWALNEDPMATEKLAEGIRKFAQDTLKLEDFLAAHF